MLAERWCGAETLRYTRAVVIGLVFVYILVAYGFFYKSEKYSRQTLAAPVTLRLWYQGPVMPSQTQLTGVLRNQSIDKVFNEQQKQSLAINMKQGK